MCLITRDFGRDNRTEMEREREREKKPVVCHWTKLNQSLRLLRRLTVTLPAAPKFIIKRLSALLAALFFFTRKWLGTVL